MGIKGIENTVGIFINTIPVRVKYSENITVIELIKELCKQEIESKKYSYCSLAQIQGLSSLKGDLIKTIFAFEDCNNSNTNNETAKNDLSIEFESERRQTNYAISVASRVENNTIKFEILYNPSEYVAEVIQTLLERIEQVLQVFISNPKGRIEEIEAVIEKEKHHILGIFNDTYTDYSRDKTIIDIFEEQVRKTPNSIAVVYGENKLTYAELNKKANQLAWKLRERGIKPDDLVVIMAERSIEMIAGIYGSMKAGGAYVPIDSTYPKDRIQYMLEDCQPKVILTFQATIKTDIPVLDLADSCVWEGMSENPGKVNKPDDLAYIIYTSGTTGAPKGVMVEHHGVVNLKYYFEDKYEVGCKDRVLQFANIIFDASVWEMNMALLNGATLVLIPTDNITDGKKFVEYCNNKEITVVTLPPNYYLQIDEIHPRLIITAGSESNKFVIDKANSYQYINAYGPTETTVCATDWKYIEEENAYKIIPIGKPISNAKIYIMDNGSLCGMGVPGELCIAGDGLARGYLNRPDLTAEKFIDNPFGEGKIYRSGDLARWLPNGNIEYLGRMDEQIKIRGFRIELSEIENVIRRMIKIKDAVVIARVDSRGDKAIHAYIVSEEEVSISSTRDMLRALLPEYMIPTYMMQIDSIPVTRSGKVDKRALPQIENLSEKEYVAPRNDIEAQLCDIFSEILGVEHVGIKDSFFKLGGDSIKAIRVVSKIRAIGYEISVKEIMNLYTVEDIANAVKVSSEENSYEQNEVTGKIKATPIIREFEEWKLVKPNHFNQDIMLDIDTDDKAQIKKVLDALAIHHDIFRAVYRDNILEILDSKESKLYDFFEFDFSETVISQAKIDTECTKLHGSISLEAGPLMKVALFKTKEGNHLFICLHHLVVDGVSWRILIEDFETAMKQVKGGKEIVLPTKTASFIQWSEALEEYKNSKQLKREYKYWEEVSSKMQEGIVKLDHNSEAIGYDSVKITFSTEETEKLVRKAGTAFNTEINDLLISAIGMSIKKLTGQQKVTIGLEGHGREEIHKKIAIDRTIGWFTSMYPVVVECKEEIRESIITTKEMLRKVPNHGIGYGLLKDKLNKMQADIYFNYLGQMDAEAKDSNAAFYTTGKRSAEENQVIGNISFSGIIVKNTLEFSIRYKKSKFASVEIAKLAELYKECLCNTLCFCVEQKEKVKTVSDYSARDLTMSDLLTLCSRFDGAIDIEDIYSLTSMQEGMLYYNVVDKSSTDYVIQQVLRLSEGTSEDKLIQALKLLVMRHDVLRTAIIHEKLSKPRQVVLNSRDVEYEKIDLSLLDEDEQKKKLEEITATDVKRGFDLQNDVLLRVKHIILGQDNMKMVWSYHHIIVDGWCQSILFSDFMRYYNYLIGGRSMSDMMQFVLTEKKGTSEFGEYLRWIEAKDREEGMTYWDELLFDYEVIAEIKPMTSPEPVENQVEQRGIKLSKEVTQSLLGMVAYNSVTINTVVEAMWGIVLQQSNATKDIVFGKVVSGRNVDIREIEKIVGIFINTIPVRVQYRDNMTVVELLRELQNQGAESDNNSYCSLADIQGLTKLKSDLIKTLLVFENHLDNVEGTWQKGNFQLQMEVAREQTNYAICILARVEAGVLGFDIMYNPNEYVGDEIQIILEKMVMVLQAFANNPQGKIEEIVTITEAERQQVLGAFNNTYIEYPKNKTMIELFEEQVEKTPNSIALVYGDVQLTYAELNEKANQLAWKLRGMGVKQDDFVVIIAERSIEMIVGIYGIIKAGGAYVPMDSTYPADRLWYMIEDCQPKAVLIYNAKIKTEIPVIELSDSKGWEGSTQNPVRINSPEDLLYMIYTSGTTGRPKGVINKHKGIVNLLTWMTKKYPINEEDVILFKTTYIFDVSVSEVFWWSLVGAKLVIAKPDDEKNPMLLAKVIEEKSVTVVNFVPSMLAVFLQNIENRETLKTIKYIIAAGEALKLADVNKFYDIVTRNNYTARLNNLYGPTESSIYATYYDCYAGLNKVLIGKPVGNMNIYILNKGLLCGIGIPGELCIGGDGVAKGYLNRLELTMEKFVKNPFGEGVMYKTGDLARWMPDGNIEYLGRIDEQVKVRGFRIELGEIENCLRQVAGVMDVAVIVREKAGDNAIFAYVVAKTDINIGEIKEELRKKLPEYMIPAYMMQLEDLPITRNGKLDKHALPQIENQGLNEYVAPRNETEIVLCNIFSEILGVEQVGINDNFFEIGGHSLSATRLVNQVEVVTGYKIMLRDIFSKPTVEKLSMLMSGKETVDYIPIPRAEEKEYYLMSSTQKRIYIVSQLDKDRISYNMPIGIVLKGTVQPELVKASMQKIIDRHEILRTNFVIINDVFLQKIKNTLKVDFTYEEDAVSTNSELLAGFVRPFELDKAPLFRVKLVKCNQYYLMLWDTYHIISDGMSIVNFIKEFTALYNGENLEPLTHQYKDYSEWFRTIDVSKQKNHWIEEFNEEIPILDMPLDYIRPIEQSHRGAIISRATGNKLHQNIKEIARKTGVTEYMVFLSALMVLLSKYSRQEEIVIGSPISARMHKDTENMLGMFVNTLAMKGKPERSKSYKDFLAEIKESCLKAYENQEYPFEDLVDSLDIKRDISRNPLFDVMLVQQNNEQPKFDLNGIEAEVIEQESTIAKFDLNFSISEVGEDFTIWLEYCIDLFKAESAESILKYYLKVIEQVVEDINIEIGDIEVINAEDKTVILSQFNDTAIEYPKDKTVIDLFEEQVAMKPNTVALVFENSQLTYSELNERANIIANRLIKLGVVDNDFVAIITERSLEMIVAICGILKAGGVYVPIDPTYPTDRINYMLEDCQPKAILTYNFEIDTKAPRIDLSNSKVWESAHSELLRTKKSKDLIYCIYTSGTSGKPKGVQIKDSSVVNLCKNFISKIYDENSVQNIALLASYAFDASVKVLFTSLITGKTLHIIREETKAHVATLVEYLYTNSMDAIDCTPTYLNLLYGEMLSCGKIASLKVALVGGEEIKNDTVENLSRETSLNIYNVYGLQKQP